MGSCSFVNHIPIADDHILYLSWNNTLSLGSGGEGGAGGPCQIIVRVLTFCILLCRVSCMIVLLLVSYRSIHFPTVLCCNMYSNQQLLETLLL